jgi:3-hydroxybutyryl-CoA dehydrogenase
MCDKAVQIALVDKIASVEDVDRAIMIHLNMPQGPFGLWDFVGLDTVWHVSQAAAKQSGDPGAQQFADMLKREYIDKGWLGVKSGRGFYTYPDPLFKRPEFLGGDPE